MPTNEEGEFELVLGNKQLLSVFFLVVLLLAVFFSMGYLAGRYTAPVMVAGGPPPDPITVPGSTAPEIEKPPAAPVEPVVPPPSKPVPAPPPMSTATPPKPEPVKPEPPKPEPPKPTPPPVKPVPVSAGSPGRGSYLQVAATKDPDADKLIQTLAAKGFRAVKMPVPDSTLVRVLVGPIESGGVPQTKAKLKLAGHDSIPRNIN